MAAKKAQGQKKGGVYPCGGRSPKEDGHSASRCLHLPSQVQRPPHRQSREEGRSRSADRPDRRLGTSALGHFPFGEAFHRRSAPPLDLPRSLLEVFKVPQKVHEQFGHKHRRGRPRHKKTTSALLDCSFGNEEPSPAEGVLKAQRFADGSAGLTSVFQPN